MILLFFTSTVVPPPPTPPSGGGGVPGWIDWTADEKSERKQGKQAPPERIKRVRGRVDVGLSSSAMLGAVADIRIGIPLASAQAALLDATGNVPPSSRLHITTAESDVWGLDDEEEARILRMLGLPV